jgi:hypothetical protein
MITLLTKSIKVLILLSLKLPIFERIYRIFVTDAISLSLIAADY